MSSKKFTTLTEQLFLLYERNLNIFPISSSYRTLKRINYYNLVNGYNYLFLIDPDSSNDEYIAGASLNEILSLYLFDKKISSLYLSKVLEIEALVKSTISYVFSELYGQKSDEYLVANNFKPQSKKDLYHLNRYLVSLNKQIWDHYKAQPYIKHYREKHGFVPLWVLINSMTFGSMNKFYGYMKKADRINVSKSLSLSVNLIESDLSNYLQSLNNFRNILAHDERFYNHKHRNRENKPYKLNFNQYFKLPTYNLNGIFSSVFTLTLILKVLLPHDNFKEFITEVFKSIDELKSNLHSIKIDNVLLGMNFLIPSKNIYTLHDVKNILYSRP